MGGFSDFLNETLPQEEVKKSAFLGFLDTFTKDEQTKKSEQTAPKIEQSAPKTGFTSFLDATLPPDSGATNAAVKENIETIPPPQTEEYVDYTQAPPKEKAPWYDDYLGLIRPLLAGAQAGAAGITKGLLKAADFISDKLGIPKSNAARIVADDLEKFSQANKARGVGGIVGDVASGIGQAAVDIPAIMALGPAGLPVYGGLMGAAEGGLPGAVTGAVSGALTHGALKGIGGLKTPARVGAGAAFGAATTPGGLEERVKGAATMGVLSATGGKPRPGVIDLRGKVPEKAPGMTVAGQTAPPPPQIQAPTARIVPEAEKPFFGRESTADYLKRFQAEPLPSNETVGRVTKPTVPATADQLGKELPHGPTITGEAPSPINPVVKTLGPRGASLTLDLVQARDQQIELARKKPIKTMAEAVAEFPVFKEHIMDKIRVAKTNVDRADYALQKNLKQWIRGTSPETGKRIMAYAAAQMKDGDAYLKSLGYDKAPELPPQEMAVYNAMRVEFERLFPLINQARNYLGHEDIGKIENYFTLMRKLPEIEMDGHDLILDPNARVLTERLQKPPEPGFFKHRGKSDLPLEEDALKIYSYYVRKANRYIEYATPTAHAKLLLEPVTYKDAAGETIESKLGKTTHDVLTNWANFATGHDAPSALEHVLSEGQVALIKSVNRNLGSAILGGNVRSIGIQPSALYNTYVEFGPKWLVKGAAQYAQGGRSEARRLSHHLFGRHFTAELSEMDAPGTTAAKLVRFWRGVKKVGTKGIGLVDYEVADLGWNIAFAKATAPRSQGGLGLSGEKAIVFADDATIRGHGSAARSDISPAQWTPEGRLLTMFQTFPIAQWNFLLKHGLGIKNPDMTTAERAHRIFRMALGALIINVFYEDLLKMRSPISAPERPLIQGLREGWSVPKIGYEMLKEGAEVAPIIGGAVRWGTERKTMLPAPIQAYSDLMRGVAKAGRAISEKDLSILGPEDLSAPFKILGVPGTSQAEKTMRRRQQGGTWPESILGQKMETLGTAPAGLSKADKTLLDKYGVGPGTSKTTPKKNQKAIDDLMKKYGVKK